MSKEKQIEEIDELETVLYEANHKTSVLNYRWLATEAYNAGYRKQSEGEWTFHKDGSGTCDQCGTTQKNVWDMDNYQSYCGHCGAKMKGGAE
jgi:hypothetical protein